MVVLMDTIVALAEGLGPAIDIPPFHTQLFEPLLQRWAATPRTDPTLVVLFECVSCILFPIRQCRLFFDDLKKKKKVLF